MTTTDDRLSCSSVSVTSQHYDWSEGYGENWDMIEPTGKLQCPECYRTAYEDEVEPTSDEDGDTLERRCPDCKCEYEEHDPATFDEGPMMNYFYALPGFDDYDAEDAARKLDQASVALCLIHFTSGYEDEEYVLALTGGGMNLSWDICEAYRVLGYMPPLFACDLPDFAGKDYTTERNKRTMDACRQSARFSMQEGQCTLERLDRLEAKGSQKDQD